MAAGMDAQDMEAKLVRDVEKAEAALLAEKDAANKAELRLIRQEAKEELNIFRRQQVAGGADPNQGCKVGPAWHAAAGGAPCGRRCPGSCHQGWQGP